ncbi:retrovirus-related pol polyprotein from transposon TNT 1-94 [Tanacetum coccineum]|uniref:Retrovirus-related pol polyprotein from transposon TNT 1-94 n=1 Tax=Tanacetum coccineum TaxID=301880 RepID=A0ABQ5IMI6_9ASTR
MESKVTTIEESKSFVPGTNDVCFSTYQKSLALKAKKESSDEECSTSRSEDEEYAIEVRDFKKFFKRRGRFVRQPQNDKKTFQRSRDDKNDDKKGNNETCLVAQASSDVCSKFSYFSDENSSIDDVVLNNEYDKLCKMSLKIITKNKRLKAIRDILEKKISIIKEKVSTLEKNKGVDLECVKWHMLKIENEKLKEEALKLTKFEKSTHCLNEMLNNQKPSGEKLGLRFNSFEASSSGTKEIKFVKAQKKASSDGGPINMGGPLNVQAAPKVNMGPPPGTTLGSEKSVSFQKSILGPRPKHIIVNNVRVPVASDNEVKKFYKPLSKPEVGFSKPNFRSKTPPPRRVINNYHRPKTPQPKRNIGRQNQPRGFLVTWNNFPRQSYMPWEIVTFSEHDSEITKDGKVTCRGIRKKGLYVMKLGNKPKEKICLATIDENSTLWHRRLGHTNMRLIQSLASKELVRNLPKLKFDQHLCDACKIGKQAHASHKAKNIVSTTRCLELLHVDLFGPSTVRSYGGNRYTLVIVDDYSREFDNEVQFGEFCNANGITHNFLAPRTPQSNGVVERKSRTLQEMSMTMLNEQSRSNDKKPKNVNEALTDDCWIVTMQEELNQFIANDVWELVPQPRNMTIIGTKWVFRNKLDENGIVSRNKARILLAYACALEFKLFQMDVKSAFLNGFINEEVYVAQPPGFIDFEKPDHVYKLKKALYGLKQAPKAWYDRLKSFLIKHEYKMGMVDNTLFTKKKSSNLIIIQIYVNDIIFGSTCQDTCDEFAKIMHDEFEMSMMGKLNFFLGLQIKQMEDRIFFNQSKYIKEMLKKFGLEESKPMKTPMSSDTKLTKDEECESVDSTKYRGMIGSLLYLTASRPDIMFSVCLCARFQEAPKTSHPKAVKCIFRYIKGTTHLGLWYPKGTGIETVFSKKQTALAISTTEAEYVSTEKACQQALWMKQALIDYDNLLKFLTYLARVHASLLTNSLDELAYGVPTDGSYQTNPPSPDDIISSIRIDREGQVRRIHQEEENNFLEYQVLSREIEPTLKPLEEIIRENVFVWGSYVLYDRVMNPLAPQQERKPRKDRGTRKGRRSTSSSSAFDQPSSSHLNDDDDDGNGEGTLRASTPSPIRYVNSLTNQVSQVFQNPPNIDPHLKPFYTRQTEIINHQVQIRDEQRGKLRSIRKGLRNLWRNIKK